MAWRGGWEQPEPTPGRTGPAPSAHAPGSGWRSTPTAGPCRCGATTRC